MPLFLVDQLEPLHFGHRQGTSLVTIVIVVCAAVSILEATWQDGSCHSHFWVRDVKNSDNICALGSQQLADKAYPYKARLSLWIDFTVQHALSSSPLGFGVLLMRVATIRGSYLVDIQRILLFQGVFSRLISSSGVLCIRTSAHRWSLSLDNLHQLVTSLWSQGS